uniref:C2 domain-containing protein n=1 Tax=Echinostoma caproni TaxID=27848 RepID=A0A183AE10_9TREM
LSDDSRHCSPGYLGELNFIMTLGEIPELRVHIDRRGALIKQIKRDRLNGVVMTPHLVHSPSEISLVSAHHMRRQQSLDAYNTLSHDFSRKHSKDLNMASVEEYEPGVDEWLLPNAAAFHQPKWPLTFYDGTNIEFYTSAVSDKTRYVNVSQLAASRTMRHEFRLENLYSRARLLVNLIRAEELGCPIHPGKNNNSPTDPHHRGSKGKATTSRGMERAVAGRPIHRSDGVTPAYQATLSIGKYSHKSRSAHCGTTPCWHEHFEFRIRLGEKTVLNLEIIDHSVAIPVLLFRGYLDFGRQPPDWTGCFTLKNDLDNYRGHVVLLVTLTGLTSTASPTTSPYVTSQDYDDFEEPVPTPPALKPKLKLPSKELLEMVKMHYCCSCHRQSFFWHLKLLPGPQLLSSPFALNVNIVGRKFAVRGARDLVVPTRGGKCNAYCMVRLVNRCVHTSTVYKTLNPLWNHVFVFPISDIYDLLEIVVLDEDKHGADILGQLRFPIVQLPNHRCKWYALKDKKYRIRERGAILLESYIEYNSVRAALRVVYPMETPWVWQAERIHLRDLQRKIDRIAPYGVYLAQGQKTFIKLYNWENRLQSCLFMIGMSLAILFVQPYMIMGGMVLLLAGCWFFTTYWFKNHAAHQQTTKTNDDSDSELWDDDGDSEEEMEEEDGDDHEKKHKYGRKKPFKVKLAKAREVLGSLQSVMEYVASILEKID